VFPTLVSRTSTVTCSSSRPSSTRTSPLPSPRRRLGEIQARLGSLSRLEAGCRDLRIVSERFRQGLRNLSYEQKARLCALFVERVEIKDEGEARLATAYLRFDPGILARDGFEGRTPPPQDEARKSSKNSKSYVNGDHEGEGYQNGQRENCTKLARIAQGPESSAYLFCVEHVLGRRNYMTGDFLLRKTLGVCGGKQGMAFNLFPKPPLI